MVVEVALLFISVMMICSQNRAAKPYVQLPYLSLEKLTAEKRACFMRPSSCAPALESISSGCGSAIPSLSHPLLTLAGIT